MKTLKALSLVMVSGLLLAACTPRDPAVLSRDEKAKADSDRARRSGDRTFPAKPGLPPDVDLAFTQHMLDRQSEIQSLLVIALEQLQKEQLAESGLTVEEAPSPVRSCQNFQVVEKSETQIVFQVDFKICKKKTPQSSLFQNGVLQMKLDLDAEKKLESLTVTSPRLEDQTLDAYRFVLTKNGKRDRAEIQDQIDLHVKRVSVQPLTYRILVANAVTKISIPMGRESLNIVMKSKSRGDLIVSETKAENPASDTPATLTISHQLVSDLRYDSKLGDANPTYLDAFLFPRDQTQNHEVMGSCQVRQGKVGLVFNFLKPFDRSNHTVTYDASKLTILDEKNPTSKVEAPVESCETRRSPAAGGIFAVDWARILLF